MGPAILGGLGILLVVAGVDLSLYVAGTVLDLGFTADVWGTYSSWATAVFPGIAIMASTRLWILDRQDRDRREVIAWASMLRRHNGIGGQDTTLFNGAPAHVLIVRTEGCGLRDDESNVCQPGETRYFRSPQGDIEVEIAAHIVRVRTDGAIDYIGLKRIDIPLRNKRDRGP